MEFKKKLNNLDTNNPKNKMVALELTKKIKSLEESKQMVKLLESVYVVVAALKTDLGKGSYN